MSQVVVLIALMKAWDLDSMKGRRKWKWELTAGMTAKQAKASAPKGVTFDSNGNVTEIDLSQSDLSGAAR